MLPGMKSLLSERMSNAWIIARGAAAQYGGSPKDYISMAMRLDVQTQMKTEIEEGRKDILAWDNFTADIEDVANVGMDRIRKPGWKAHAQMQRDKIYELIGKVPNATRQSIGHYIRQHPDIAQKVQNLIGSFIFSSDQETVDEVYNPLEGFFTLSRKDLPEDEHLTNILDVLSRLGEIVRAYEIAYGEELDF